MVAIYDAFNKYMAVILFVSVSVYGNNAHITNSKRPLTQAPKLESIVSDEKVHAHSKPPTTMAMITSRSPARIADATNRHKLPTWFNYEQFKQFFGKRYLKPEEDEIHKRIYLRTAMKILEQRALFRVNRTNTLPSINELSDMTTAQLLALRRIPQEASHKVADQLTCCTYDQVHDGIIKLMEDASRKEDTIPGLSDAYVVELQQEPILVTTDQDLSETGMREDTDSNHERRIAKVQSSTSSASRSAPSSSSREGAKVRNSHLSPSGASLSSTRYFNSNRGNSDPVFHLLKTTLKPQTAKSTVVTGGGPEDVLLGDDNSTTTEESSDFDPEIAEKVRQQIERQLSNTTQGRQLAEQLSSYFGQPVKLTASIATPPKSVSASKIKSQPAHL